MKQQEYVDVEFPQWMIELIDIVIGKLFFIIRNS